jgi:hypothetical protein
MEDKNKKPVDTKQLKKPTGTSVTGKPLDGIEIRPQLKGLGNRQHNEDTVVLTDTLAEKKALTLVQRQRRARILRAKEPKMQRAKEVAQHKLASDDKLKARAIVKARNIVKMRFAARKGTPYTELTTSEKIQVDKVVDKKVKLIRRLAARLLPALRKAEVNRLASFQSGSKIQHATAPAVNEEFNTIVESLDNKTSMQLVDIINDSIDALNENDNSMGITLKRLLSAVLPEDVATSTLMKKAERTGIPFSTLREVFERGSFAWEDDGRTTQEQFSFSRVNSYIAKGRAWTLDADLREEKVSFDVLDSAFNTLAEKRGLWDNIHDKRKRIKAGSKERMRKPGSKGAPTASAFRDAAEAVETNPSVNKKDTSGQSVAVSTKLDRKSHEFVDRGAFNKGAAKRHQEIKKKIIDESNNKPYVKPFTEKGSTQQRGWKASNKHGKVKYFGMDFKASAHKHAGINEAAEKHPIAKEYDSLKKHDIKTLHGLIKQQSKVVDTSEFKTKDHAISHYLRNKHGHKKVDAAFGFKEDTAADREVGTKSLVKKYQKETPGQEKADLNESFNIEFAAGIGVGLTANECGIFIKPGFEMHPSVVEEEKETKSDFRMVKVRTPKGWAWRKVRREVDIEKGAE